MRGADSMKKLFCLVFVLLLTSNVCAEEIQLTDYNFTYGKRVYDGFSVVAYSSTYVVNDRRGGSYNGIEEGYLKPNGTMLYCSEDYVTNYGNHTYDYKPYINFNQNLQGDICVFHCDRPYKRLSFATMTLFDRDGKIKYQGEPDSLKLYKDINGNNIVQKEWDEIVDADPITEESRNERVDRSYSFREKQINGQTYYALFKELKDGETAADFAPTEQPTSKYTDYINQMYKKGLLFNNEMCFYKRGITRLDFGIVLGRAYCNATGYSIDRFTTDTKFADVNNPYCLYLSDNGILTSTNALGYTNGWGHILYLNEKEITKKDVSDALDKAAEKCGVLTEWNSIKVIQPTDAVCSRELAYVETFRLYDLIRQHNSSNYTAFQPSEVLNSDSEAETMHYETVNYEENTEMTTQGTIQGNSTGNDKAITVTSVIGSIAAVLAGIGNVIKG